MSSKPAIIIVHGAWCRPKPAYEPLKLQIEGLGYECYLPNLYTAGGNEIKGKTWEADVKDILDVALPLFDQGKDVAIIAHSYGGVPATIATQGQSVEERARQGKIGGFTQILFVAAFAVPQKGMDMFTLFGGTWPTWAGFAPAYTKNQTIQLLEAAKPVLFGDLPEAQKDEFFKGVVLHSQDSFETPVTYSAADLTIPKSYLVCTQDLCVPGPMQEQLAQALNFKFEKIDAGHFPFLSQPEKCLELIQKLLE